MSNLVFEILRTAATLAKTEQIQKVTVLKARLQESYPGQDVAIQEALSLWGDYAWTNSAQGRAAAADEAKAAAPTPEKRALFSIDELPDSANCRWFIRRNGVIHLERGFQSKAAANEWIAGLGHRVDWRVGYRFRLRGDTCDMDVVSRTGVLLKP